MKKIMKTVYAKGTNIPLRTIMVNEKKIISSKPLLPAVSRHKWVKDAKGKECSLCRSRVNTTGVKYIETDKWGIRESVNWYPRCYPNSR